MLLEPPLDPPLNPPDGQSDAVAQPDLPKPPREYETNGAETTVIVGVGGEGGALGVHSWRGGGVLWAAAGSGGAQQLRSPVSTLHQCGSHACLDVLRMQLVVQPLALVVGSQFLVALDSRLVPIKRLPGNTRAATCGSCHY